MSETTPELCAQCGHEFDPHVLVTTSEDAVDGGVMLCPVPGCLCWATWGYQKNPTKRVPDEAEIAALRADIQKPRPS